MSNEPKEYEVSIDDMCFQNGADIQKIRLRVSSNCVVLNE